MENSDLLKIGFKEIPHFTIGDAIIYDLGRHRQISASCIGTPNEMVYLCETSDQNEKEITDLICVHNYDYDGYLTMNKIINLIKAITTNK